jgi:hypothetical protein
MVTRLRSHERLAVSEYVDGPPGSAPVDTSSEQSARRELSEPPTPTISFVRSRSSALPASDTRSLMLRPASSDVDLRVLVRRRSEWQRHSMVIHRIEAPRRLAFDAMPEPFHQRTERPTGKASADGTVRHASEHAKWHGVDTDQAQCRATWGRLHDLEFTIKGGEQPLAARCLPCQRQHEPSFGGLREALPQGHLLVDAGARAEVEAQLSTKHATVAQLFDVVGVAEHCTGIVQQDRTDFGESNLDGRGRLDRTFRVLVSVRL